MASLADEFDRPDSGSLGSNWKEYTQGFGIYSGAAEPTSDYTSVAQFTTSLATGNHEVEMRVGHTFAGSFVGVAARMPTIGTNNAGTGTFYLFLSYGSIGDSFTIRRKEAGVNTITVLGSGNTASPARNDGDVYRLRVVDDPRRTSAWF